MSESERPKKTDAGPTAKRKYATPHVTEYGDLRLHTLNRGPSGKGDGGVHPNNKTGT